jgi:hypothetical protein
MTRSLRWKPLEGALACVGAVADDLQELLEEERESGMLPSFDLQTLFDNVVPQLLTMTGESGNRVMISAVRS